MARGGLGARAVSIGRGLSKRLPFVALPLRPHPPASFDSPQFVPCVFCARCLRSPSTPIFRTTSRPMMYHRIPPVVAPQHARNVVQWAVALRQRFRAAPHIPSNGLKVYVANGRRAFRQRTNLNKISDGRNFVSRCFQSCPWGNFWNFIFRGMPPKSSNKHKTVRLGTQRTQPREKTTRHRPPTNSK